MQQKRTHFACLFNSISNRPLSSLVVLPLWSSGWEFKSSSRSNKGGNIHYISILFIGLLAFFLLERLLYSEHIEVDTTDKRVAQSYRYTSTSVLYIYMLIYIHVQKKTYDRHLSRRGKSCRNACVEEDDRDLNHIQTEMMRQHRNCSSHLLLYNMFVNKWQSTLSYLLCTCVTLTVFIIYVSLSLLFFIIIIDKRIRICTSSI